MTPTSLEEAIRYFQYTAGSLQKSTVKLDESLEAINKVLVRSCADEVVVPVPVAQQVYLEKLGPNMQVKPITAVGIVRFQCAEGEDEILALGLRCDVIEPETDVETGEVIDHVPVWNWIPLVSLPGFGAPKLAPRRLRVWAANHLKEWVDALATKITNESVDTQEAALHAKELAKAMTDSDTQKAQ